MGVMRSKLTRRTVALGLSSLVLLTGLSLAPVGSAFAEDEVVPAPGATSTTAPDTTPSLAPAATPEPTVVPEPSASPEQTTVPDDVPRPELPDTSSDSDQKGIDGAPLRNPDWLNTSGEPLQFSRMAAMSSTAGFNAGNIISDQNFYDSWAMSESEIQAFLDARISGPCQNSNCLNVLKMNTVTTTMETLSPRDPYGTCDPYIGAQNESAARIIFKVQRACGISAKVLLVVLQKETSLVTSRAPSSDYLQKALGYGCPDTGTCDPNFYGFFRQIYGAGRQFTWYNNPAGSHTSIKVGQHSTRYYNSNPACGSSQVLIQNKATAALYYYTPWQPNASALAAPWGVESPDPCAAYGNLNFWRLYNSWFGDPTGVPAKRIAGENRYATAAAISRSVFGDTGAVPVAYVATGEDFPDALAAGPAAAVQGGPLLLTNPAFLPDSTIAELRRLKPKKVIIVGGPGTVSAGVADHLNSLAREFNNSPATTVTRIAGADRYETSRLIAAQAFPQASGAYIATGWNFPDALSATAAAGSKKQPVILVNGLVGAVDAATVDSLKRIGVGSIIIVGGEPSIAPQIQSGLASAGFQVRRLAGTDRYETSVEVNRDAFPSPSTAYLATGLNFPDALAGAAAAAKVGSPLYVTFPGCVNPGLRADLKRPGVTGITLLGGTPSLAAGMENLPGC